MSVAALRMWVLFCDALIDKPIQLKINYRSRLNLDKAIQEDDKFFFHGTHFIIFVALKWINLSFVVA